MSIEVYTDYTFMDNENSKYCLSVNYLSTYIEFFMYSDKAHKWCKKEGIDIPSNFAYEIAKKIIEEYEKMNKDE